ncbi:hypothetical protein [Arenibaculum pallidiluteum]|uniref:hypothetical protein n=1 Tax=Arenibaculum pallidiluteum TaxID=2812559 RepID=UPI001A95837E|nr:hypothetical protein [Arenibaculum pallidiluteum]
MPITNSIQPSLAGFPAAPQQATRARQESPHRSLGGTVLAGLAAIIEGLAAYRRWTSLNALSDAELARRGLDRRDIARHAILGPIGGQA